MRYFTGYKPDFKVRFDLNRSHKLKILLSAMFFGYIQAIFWFYSIGICAVLFGLSAAYLDIKLVFGYETTEIIKTYYLSYI